MEDKKNKRKALIISLLLYITAGVIFLFVGLKYPDPPLEETGIEIAMADFGFDDSGSGEVEPTESSAPVEESTPTPTEAVEESVDEVEEEVVTEEDSEIAAPPPVTESTSSEEEPVEEEEEQVEEVAEEPVIDERLQNVMGAWSESEAATSEGSQDQGEGNEGLESGNPSGKGTFGGNGSSFELGGRSMIAGPSMGERPKEEGKVVLNIWVDRDGNIKRMSNNLQESTTTSQYLFNLAKKAAEKAKFNASPNSAPEQRGKMTFIFILQ